MTEAGRSTLKKLVVRLGEKFAKVDLLLMFLEAKELSACPVLSWVPFVVGSASVAIVSLGKMGVPYPWTLCFDHLVQYPIV